MTGIIAWWARNPVAANLAMVGILVAGFLAYSRMEQEVFPTFPVNVVNVSVTWPGASPEDVEQQIVLRIEEALVDLDNVDRLTSFASEGLARVQVEADPRVDIGTFVNDVQLRVNAISGLPSGVEPPRTSEILTRQSILLLAVHGDVGERQLSRTAEWVRDQIALLPGASITRIFTDRREEVSIEVSEEALRRYNLTFDDVAQAVRASSLNLSAGRVRTDTGELQLRARNLADTKAEFERIVVRQTDDGAVIRVGDVATVIDGFEEVDSRTLFNGEPASLLGVMSTEQMNVVETSQSVRGWLETANDDLPPGVQVSLWFDNSDLYFDRMSSISRNAVMGLILVFIVLILFLRPAVAVWVTIGIATAFAGAFVLLPSLDVSLNMLSLFSFLLVIGIVVDDAIIVGEKIHAQVEEGYEGLKAAVLGTQLVLKPVMFAVITTIIAFAPWLFITGSGVQATRQMSMIVIAALAFSLIEAMLILPAHLAHLKQKTRRTRIARWQQGLGDSLILFARRVYRPVALFCVRQRYLTASIFFFFLMMSFGLFSTGIQRFAFLPDVENELVQVNVEFPAGTPFSVSAAVQEQLVTAQNALTRRYAEQGDDDLIRNWLSSASPGSTFIYVLFAPPQGRNIPVSQLAGELRELIGEIPQAKNVSLDFSIGGSAPDLQFSLNAPELEVLRAASLDLKEQLQTYGPVFDVSDDLESGTRELRIALLPGAEQLGVTLQEVSRQVRQAYFGEEVQRLPRDGEDVRVYVRYPEEARRDISSLQSVRIRLPDGRQVPLFSVAEVETAPGVQTIIRRERQRSTVVSGYVAGDEATEIRADLNETFFPEFDAKYPTMTRGVLGEAEGLEEFQAEIAALYTIAFLAMYAMLAIAFRSYWQPLLIMTAIPFGFMGAVYGHMIFGLTLSLFSYFGIAAAAGVVVNDNLVLVDAVNQARDKGRSAIGALVDSGVSRFRPIILTSVTTFIGLVPMISEQSTQAQFLKGTVVALAFGILFATFVTLLLVPALYAIGADIARFSRWLWTGESQPPLDADAPAKEA